MLFIPDATFATIKVYVFPPKLSYNNLVSFDSL